MWRSRLAVPRGGGPEGTILPLGPVAYWPMQEASGNIVDIIGGRIGTANGGLTYRQPGPAGTFSIVGDGTSGYFDCGDIFDFEGVVPFSVLAYARTDLLTTGKRVISKIASSTTGWDVLLPNNTGAVTGARNGASGAVSVAPLTGIVQSRWSAFVLRFDGTNVYLDTRWVSAVAPSAPGSSNAGHGSTLKIGAQSNTSNNWWNGGMAHCAIFIRCLSGAEVQRLTAIH